MNRELRKEKQELIEYLKEQIKEYKKELSYRYQEDHEIVLAKGILTLTKIYYLN